jgi:hypothetical protein
MINPNEEYYAIPVYPVDSIIHDEENPFCDDPTCPCHEDEGAIGQVDEMYQDGIITADDATEIVKGRRHF